MHKYQGNDLATLKGCPVMNGVESMKCIEVRDRFSSLFEGDLKPAEEGKVREHLASCPDCQKEWEQFKRTIQWLHTVEEEEVPEGFLFEIQKKREERKGKERGEGARFFRSIKIPIQAAAMVMILLVALYLTKMTPFEVQQEKAVPKTEVSYSAGEKKESVLKEEEQAKVTLPPPVSYRKDYISEAKVPGSDERSDVKEGIAQKMKEKDIEPPAPPLKEEMASVKTSRPKEMASVEATPLEEKRMEKDQVGRVMRPLAKKSIREITLKIKDREKAIFQLQDLAKQLGGEMVREEENVFMASLPGSSFAEFEKGLVAVGSPPPVQKTTAPKEMKDELSLAAGGKSKESEEKGREPVRSMSLKEEPIFIRIHILLE